MLLFRLRLAEWINALVIFLMGMTMWVFPESFNRGPSLALFAANADFWTMACLGVGVIRLMALYINGHWGGGTPLIRMLGSIAGAAMFGAFIGNFIGTSTSTSVSWAIAVYSGMLLGELFSGYFSAIDVFNAKKK